MAVAIRHHMRKDLSTSTMLALICATTMWGCQMPQSPSSPSAITQSGIAGSNGGGRFRTRGASDDPYYPTDPAAPGDPAAGDPGAGIPGDPGVIDPTLPADPNNPLPPGTIMPLDPTQPIVLPDGTKLINIVNTFGPQAFAPNPTAALTGESVAWLNSDVRMHHIVMDDGREIGDVMPGQMTMPIVVDAGAPASFHCTLHPSMVGAINGDPLVYAPPPDDTAPEMPPPYDYYGHPARARVNRAPAR